ncbi:unnamed protein product [Rangifer tarandus platyrhynchus]|uniref:Uncharacterized protein n=1 Tax=Rangifer tarandus platyrhynchus TaxID=3082113 RepID=A0AC59ZP21_RANTA
MARAATAAAPRLLRAAMLLLLLVAACRRAAGAPVVNELRCHCLQTLQGIHLKNIQSVKVTPPGPHCGQTEVIATLKNGQEACLNPEAPMVKKIINKMLNKRLTRPWGFGYANDTPSAQITREEGGAAPSGLGISLARGWQLASDQDKRGSLGSRSHRARSATAPASLPAIDTDPPS